MICTNIASHSSQNIVSTLMRRVPSFQLVFEVLPQPWALRFACQVRLLAVPRISSDDICLWPHTTQRDVFLRFQLSQKSMFFLVLCCEALHSRATIFLLKGAGPDLRHLASIHHCSIFCQRIRPFIALCNKSFEERHFLLLLLGAMRIDVFDFQQYSFLMKSAHRLPDQNLQVLRFWANAHEPWWSRKNSPTETEKLSTQPS